MEPKNYISMIFNIFVKKEDDEFIAHCMELDIVATGAAYDATIKDIVELVAAQISYAFSNDNLLNLYHPAPREVWEEFYTCKPVGEIRIPVKGSFNRAAFIPPWIIAKTCLAESFASV